MSFNTDFESPNLVVFKVSGIMEEADIDPMYDMLEETTKKVGTVDLLVDMSELDNIPPKAREKVKARGAGFTDYKRIAVFGARPAVRVLGGLILKIMPQSGEMKFFKTEDEARAWLTEN